MIVFLLATLQAESTPHIWLIVTGSLGTLFVAVILSSFFVGRFFPNTREAHKEQFVTAPRTEKPPAFLAPSKQRVNQKLPHPGKELPPRHPFEKKPPHH